MLDSLFLLYSASYIRFNEREITLAVILYFIVLTILSYNPYSKLIYFAFSAFYFLQKMPVQ